MKSVTRDSIAMRGAGIVHVAQPSTGHRFTLDSILLADFCRVKPGERVLEPGAGTGIISLLLAKKHARSFFFPVEVQDDLHSLCIRNYMINELGNVDPLHRDIRRLSRPVDFGHVDVLVTNPPYLRSGTGRSSPDTGRKISRQDMLARIEFWFDLGKHLKQGGRYNIVFPASRLAELMALMRKRRLEPKRARLVHPYQDKPAALVLLEAVKEGGTGVEMLPPLVVHEPGGAYSREMKDIYDMK
ncbi:MAG: methyltransferase [Nitrospirota bacterium]|nr:methyltransferase [Nitrospirota bacterium]